MKIFPIFIPFQGCKNRCIYCNQNIITKSESINWQTLQQKIIQIVQSNANKYDEIAFYGGTFSAINRSLQEKLLYQPDSAKPIHYRFSTAPNTIRKEDFEFYQSRCVKTIELGVQSFSDDVLRMSKRNYTKEIALQSSLLIKKSGFKLGLQLMPGLPGSDEKSFHDTIQQTILLKPDYVRIYPVIVLRDTELEALYRTGKYTPLTLQRAVEICSQMKSIFEKESVKVIKIGLHSDIRTTDVVAGPYHESFGELVKAQCLINEVKQYYTTNSILHFSKKDESLLKGYQKFYLNRLKNELSVPESKIVNDEKMPSGKFKIVSEESIREFQIW
jgi:histone acetyltransferase (RNA polymerase elongator complex component)